MREPSLPTDAQRQSQRKLELNRSDAVSDARSYGRCWVAGRDPGRRRAARAEALLRPPARAAARRPQHRECRGSHGARLATPGRGRRNGGTAHQALAAGARRRCGAALAGNAYLPLSHIRAYSYFDLTAAVAVGSNVTLRLGVNNVLDKAPPLLASGADCDEIYCNGNTLGGTYRSLGRYLFAQITANLGRAAARSH